MSKVILDLAKMKSEGSGKGWSYHSRWLGCTKQAALLEKAKARGEDPMANSHMRVGSIVHKLLEIHEGATGYRDVIIKNAEPFQEEVNEAWEIFKHYRGYYPPSWFGDVLHRELLVGDPAYLSGRLDLLLRVRKVHLSRWAEVGVSNLVPGVYITDYKVHTPQYGQIDYTFFRDNPQFTNYFNLYEERRAGEKKKKNFPKADGTLVMIILRQERKKPPVKGLFIPAPGEQQQKIFQTALQLSKDAQLTKFYWPNVTLCGKGPFRCVFYRKECDLHSPIERTI